MIDVIWEFVKQYPELSVLVIVVTALWLVSDCKWTHREP